FDEMSFALCPRLIYSRISLLLRHVSSSSFTAKGSLRPEEMKPDFVFEYLPTMMFSNDVKSPNNSRCWNVREIPRLDLLREDRLLMSIPQRKTSPLSGASMPVIML